MTVGHALFSFTGRMTRSDYWLKGFLPLLPIGILNNVLAYGVGTDEARTIAIVISLISMWPALALVVKRLHDRNRSGWFALIFLIPIIGPIWLLIEVIFLRGTTGPNRFGDGPLQKSIGTTKKCPRCAEEIKPDALVCRYCGYEFDDTEIMKIKKSLQAQASLKEKQTSLKKISRSYRNSRVGGLFFTFFGTVFILLSITSYFSNPKDGIWVPLFFILVFSPLVLAGILLFKKANKFKIDLMKLNAEIEELTRTINVSNGDIGNTLV